MVYHQLCKESQPSKKMWTVSCAVVAGAICMASFVAYSVIVGSAFLMHAALYYLSIVAALGGLGLCAGGVVYFDKDPAYSQGFDESTKDQ